MHYNDSHAIIYKQLQGQEDNDLMINSQTTAKWFGGSNHRDRSIECLRWEAIFPVVQSNPVLPFLQVRKLKSRALTIYPQLIGTCPSKIPVIFSFIHETSRSISDLKCLNRVRVRHYIQVVQLFKRIYSIETQSKYIYVFTSCPR